MSELQTNFNQSNFNVKFFTFNFMTWNQLVVQAKHQAYGCPTRVGHGSIFLDPTQPDPLSVWPDPTRQNCQKIWPDPSQLYVRRDRLLSRLTLLRTTGGHFDYLGWGAGKGELLDGWRFANQPFEVLPQLTCAVHLLPAEARSKQTEMSVVTARHKLAINGMWQ